ncbi:MAG: hypothetical protein EXQ91_03605 [Alphaproteobacteria bacterium]|nr:hypothetical protein [Alphaproteobacteria bacterium]
MIITVVGQSFFWNGHRIRCAVGRAGITRFKREGDGATPAGRFPLRNVLFRPDRLPPPETGLHCAPLAATAGWCDDASDPAYNRPVTLPYPAGHERLWRGDGVYDVIVTLGYNDDPVERGLGSAIFLHVAAADYAPTTGCVAIALNALLALLRNAGVGDDIQIEPDA